MNIVTLSSQNQITIPAAYVREFGLAAGGKFLVDKKDDELSLKPVKGSIVDELAGSLEQFIPEDKKGVPIEKAIRLAKIIHAREVATKK